MTQPIPAAQGISMRRLARIWECVAPLVRDKLGAYTRSVCKYPSSHGSIGGSPADFAKLIADETEKWGKVIKSAGIKPE